MGNRQRALPPALPSFDRNQSYTFANPRPQNFSLRSPIVKYILKNPTGKAWKKLIKTCKYFFAKYPVFPVKRLYGGSTWHADLEKFDLVKNCVQFWLFDEFGSTARDDIFEIISKVIKCDIQALYCHHQALTWDTYQILSSSGSLKEIVFCNCSFKYSNGNDVTMDKLLENLQKIEKFKFIREFESKIFENGTVQKMTKILPSFKKMRSFKLLLLKETFNLSSFMEFLMKNETIAVSLEYDRDSEFSDTFTQMLETCFEQLLGHPPKKLPKILFPKFDEEKNIQYENLCFKSNV